MLIESKIIITKSFPRGVSKISFGNYAISPVSYFSATEIEASLSFTNHEDDNNGRGHPEEEVDIVCKLLSVFLNARIRKLGTVADESSIPVFDGRERKQYPQFFGYLEHESLDDLINRVRTLDEKMARQVIRACRCYAYSLELIPSDPAFAFFLLVSSGKCISSMDEIIPFSDLDLWEKESERFAKFILDYFPAELKSDDANEDQLVNELLVNASCYHRKSFIHGNDGIKTASREADKNGSSYAQVMINNIEVKIPGLTWLSKVVRGSLIGYLNACDKPSSETVDDRLFSVLALEKAKLIK